MMVRKQTSEGTSSEAQHVRSYGGIVEERLGTLIVDGQSREVWIRSEPDEGGTWHNALLFYRDGQPSRDARAIGVDWHLPPGFALERARELPDHEQHALFQRALRPRPPLL